MSIPSDDRPAFLRSPQKNPCGVLTGLVHVLAGMQKVRARGIRVADERHGLSGSAGPARNPLRRPLCRKCRETPDGLLSPAFLFCPSLQGFLPVFAGCAVFGEHHALSCRNGMRVRASWLFFDVQKGPCKTFLSFSPKGRPRQSGNAPDARTWGVFLLFLRTLPILGALSTCSSGLHSLSIRKER